MKWCYRCKTSKPASEFHASRSKPDGLACECKLCRREMKHVQYMRRRGDYIRRATEWKKRNRERFLELNRANYDPVKSRAYRATRREHLRAYGKVYYAKNTERLKRKQAEYAKANAARVYARTREWQAKNKDKYRLLVNEWASKRRAMLRSAAVGDVDYAAIAARDNMRCHICKKRVKRADLSFDHVVPIAKGGLHCATNICVAHLKCNISKHAKLLHLPFDVLEVA